MATVNVTIRMDETLKKQADELFSDFGLTLNAAFTMFAKQAVREQRIPFEITRNPAVVTASNEAVTNISQQLIDKNREAYEELAK
jgi:DNA-damage-inducible protein J